MIIKQLIAVLYLDFSWINVIYSFQKGIHAKWASKLKRENLITVSSLVLNTNSCAYAPDVALGCH